MMGQRRLAAFWSLLLGKNNQPLSVHSVTRKLFCVGVCSDAKGEALCVLPWGFFKVYAEEGKKLPARVWLVLIILVLKLFSIERYKNN